MIPNPPRAHRAEPMPVKYWSFAGLMLTNWCNARCASCYENCSPDRAETMSVAAALDCWQQLRSACPHDCRIHLTGGEPFGNWPGLMDLLTQAHAAGLTESWKIETNAFWAVSADEVRQRVRELGDVGIDTLCISADPYHQQFVPIERCRLLATIAAEVLGPDRVQVRWRDWLAEGVDTDAMSDTDRTELFLRYFRHGRERLTGRAVRTLAGHLPLMNPQAFADSPCNGALLRGRHVHVCPGGEIMPGTCVGIVLGTIGESTVSDLWSDLAGGWDRRPIVGELARGGPLGLLERAQAMGFEGPAHYATKCHLCWTVRSFLAGRGEDPDELGPGWLYDS